MINKPYNLKIIVLGAGKSERFNAIKLLAEVNKNDYSTTLIEHVLAQITSSLTTLNIETNSLNVATGKYHEQISNVIGKLFTCTYCSNADLGLGHTIAQAVKIITHNSHEVSHIMITLADQIALTSDDYIQLIKASNLMPDKLTCSKSGSQMLPPAIFPAHYFSQLMSLTGDKGAKTILHDNIDNIEAVSIPNAIDDIDTKDDLINWHKQLT